MRSRLIVSHVAVIALAFTLTALVAFVPIQRAQLRAERDRLLGVADTVALQTDVVTRSGSSGVGAAVLQGLIARQGRLTGTYVLLVRADGTIVSDSRGPTRLEGQRRPELAAQIERLDMLAAQQSRQSNAPQAVSIGIGRFDGHEAALATTTRAVDGLGEPLYALVVSPRDRLPFLDRLARPLLFAGGLALLAGIVASVLIARSISGPLSRLTTAVGAVTPSNLDRRVPEVGDGEVGALARAFNAMIERLGAAYAAQRTLLDNIAHELRTPLTSIQGYAQAVRDGVAEGPARDEALEIIGDEAERMGALVNQILQLSRLESGQAPLRAEPLALAPLLERLRRSVAPQAGAADVSLSAAAPDDLLVIGDAELLTQALGNLLTNAVRHTPAGGSVSIVASRLARPDGRPFARVAVADSGSGIASDDLARIFERFYRGDGQSGAAASGRRFGLGLAITREIVMRHGGEIAVTSEPDHGTTFTVDLPTVVDDDRVGHGATEAPGA